MNKNKTLAEAFFKYADIWNSDGTCIHCGAQGGHSYAGQWVCKHTDGCPVKIASDILESSFLIEQCIVEAYTESLPSMECYSMKCHETSVNEYTHMSINKYREVAV